MKRISSILLTITMLLAAIGSACAQGSWGQINQPIGRAEGWTAFVEESPFALGEGVPLTADPSVTVLDWGTYPSLDGSTVCVPMAMELARQLLGMEESDLNGFVAFSTTHYAYERLIGRKPNPTVTILSKNAMLDDARPVNVFLGTEPSDEELALAKEAGVTLKLVPFCYDAFVFLVNAQNPVNDLSLSQIREIYTGKITDWGTVGGAAGKAIIPFQRPKNSGSQTAMENLVMQGVRLTGAVENYVSDGMSDLVQQIGNYDNGPASLGYSYLYYVDVLYKSGDIKTLSVDGVSPTAENIRSGAYPFATNYYVAYLEGDEQAAAFAEWMQGSAGQQCVAQAGYIPYIQP